MWHNFCRKHNLGFAMCLLLGMVLSVIDRTDANWDLQNYHLYAPYAALHGRLGMDWFAAGFQAYLNPAEDIPYYIVKMVWFPNHPVLVAALAGLPFGFLIFVTYGIAWLVLKDARIAIFATVLGLTGATVLSEVGTTYDDILTADFVLTAIWLFLADTQGAIRRVAAGGFLLGCAVGLKLTAVLYLPGAALLAVLRRPRSWWRELGLIGSFSLLGFLAVSGWWSLLLWTQFGNPFFPMVGSLFPKSAVPGMSFHDPRFMPRNLWQWLFYPFFWLQGRSFVVSEEPLRDPRFALAYVALGCRLAGVFLSAQKQLSRNAAALIGFFILSYLCWLIGFSILRYALALEAISGIIIFAALLDLMARRNYLFLIGAATIFALIFTKPMGWGRIGYGKSLISIPVPAIPANATVLMAGAPIGFVIPYLNAPSAKFLSLDLLRSGTPRFDLIQTGFKAGDDAELLTNASDSELGLLLPKLALLGRTFDERDCVAIHSPVQKMIRLCQLLP